jgi:carboxylate-amine ligase
VEWLSQKYDDDAELPTLPNWFVSANKWRAARYGLDATVISNSAGDQTELRPAICHLVAKLMATAEKLNCTTELSSVLEIVERGASYERQRRVFQLASDSGATTAEALEGVVAHLAAEMRADQPIYRFAS